MCWVFTHIFTVEFNFKEFTARRLYKSFGVKRLKGKQTAERAAGKKCRKRWSKGKDKGHPRIGHEGPEGE
jgi:hypothetical protein